MKPLIRAAAIFALATAPVVSAPVLAHPIQSAGNHAYAVGSQQAQGLSPMWHEYHNWRSRDAYQTRLALHRKVERGHSRANYGVNEGHASTNGPSTAYSSPTLQEQHNWRAENGVRLRKAMNRNEG